MPHTCQKHVRVGYITGWRHGSRRSWM